MMAEVALCAAAAIHILRILRESGLLAGFQYLDAQAAAIRRSQGCLEREQEQQQDDEDATDTHAAPL
jgi:hypothetical protein